MNLIFLQSKSQLTLSLFSSDKMLFSLIYIYSLELKFQPGMTLWNNSHHPPFNRHLLLHS